VPTLPAADSGVVEHPWLVVKMAMAINRREYKTFILNLCSSQFPEQH